MTEYHTQTISETLVYRTCW